MEIACPHCQTANQTPGNFCGSCGKALPALSNPAARVVAGNNLASSKAGQSLQLDLLARQMRSAFRALLGVGLFQFIIGIGLAVLASFAKDKAQDLFAIGLGVGIVGLIFLALSAWARKSPLPAAVTGMVLFLSLWALDAVVGFMNGDPAAAFRGWLIKLIVVAALGKAISAGLKHKALRREMDDEASSEPDENSGVHPVFRQNRAA